ncbi:MAG: HAMP domain-containing sensor histidine kinase [Oscillospiraceae bacterium]|nr:HAMP domain-containing sensor histidine kinase [Oscillospiraceae bacterium]
MTIKKRLVVSNILMILVPVFITIVIAAASVGIIWFTVTNGSGIGFEDSESFYRLAPGIASTIEKSLKDTPNNHKLDELPELARLLNNRTIALSVKTEDETIYSYGEKSDSDSTLLNGISEIGGEGYISNGTREVYVRQVVIDNITYHIEIFTTPVELSYTTLKIVCIIAFVVLLLGILISILLTNRFLTKFVFKKIETPLDILANGVAQISDGNLDYRINYTPKDEFAPVCEEFNEMAARLKTSVERSQQHEQSRKELLAGISHDIRSPLTSIRAYVEGLLDGVAKTSEAQRKYLETIKSKSDDIDRMVAKIFLFSKMELGDYPDNLEILRLDEEVRCLVQAIGAEYEEKGLIISANKLIPATVSADPDQLRRVLVNIIENSLKYKTMEIGTLIISLREENGSYRLSLCDDGPGVPEEALPHLFEVFYRCDPSRQNPNRGSGLGLAIAANAIARMNGTIMAENCKTGGLNIIICLPKVVK